MKKKRILLAALASICVAAGAAGMAACSNGGETHDPALYAAYQSYAATVENAPSYEDWIAELLSKLNDGGQKGDPGERGDDGKDGIDGEDGVGIDDVKMVEINGKQYFEFTFSNGKGVRLAVDGSDRQESVAFTINAVDNNGAPVADAYFNVGYTDNFNTRLTKAGTTTDDSSQYCAVKSNPKGIATLNTFPEEYTGGYSVYLADPASIPDGSSVPNVPKGYTVDFGTSQGINNTSAPFVKEGSNYSVTVNFKIDNSWNSLYDPANDLDYKRFAEEPLTSSTFKVTSSPYVKRAQKGKYNYFTFYPYYENRPQGELSESDIEKIISKAREAASGVYRLTYTADNSGANVQLNAFDFMNGSYFVKNEDGSPADSLVAMRSGNVPTDSETLQAAYQRYRATERNSALDYDAWLVEYSKTFSGGNYVDVTVEQDEASATFCLGFTTDVNCNVTITVERIGDVRKWSNEYSTAKMPQDELQAMENDGRILDVPLDAVIVRDEKGVYHLNSATGPEIYVQLNNPTRVNSSFSMLYLSDYSEVSVNPEGGTTSEHLTVFNYYTETTDDSNNTGVRTYTDYTAVVKGYSALANSDGGYPVNDLLKTILENFCKSFIGWGDYDEYWVAACYYYGTPSDGTENAPYDITTGANTVDLNAAGTTYLSFKPSASGYYTVVSSAGTPSVTNGIVIDNTTYFYASSAQGVTFTVAGSGSATVTIGTVAANKVIEYAETTSSNSDGTFTQTVTGTAENPVNRSGIGVFQVNVDHSAYSGKIAVDFKAALGGDGTYSITVYGSSTATVETGEAGNYTSVLESTFTMAYATATRLWFDNSADGTFFIKVTKLS